ncbi:photosynthetic complex putative assembly protein PuhB [Magnetospirillum fulvum]|nr:photosynthetic complex putative assembly protein PuhB [Magnetospirillum fulvum]
MSDHDHHFEMVPGLPGPLPQGERLLWQGSPSWWQLTSRAFHFGWLAAYFGVLAAWRVASTIADGGGALDATFAGGLMVVGGLAAAWVLIMIGWSSARATTYSITNRRVVISHGVALPLSVNLPFGMIESAELKTYSDGTGDISLSLNGDQHLAYLVLWPHARPWRFSKVEPTLRAVPGAVAIARILGAALVEAAPAHPAAADPVARENAEA